MTASLAGLDVSSRYQAREMENMQLVRVVL